MTNRVLVPLIRKPPPPTPPVGKPGRLERLRAKLKQAVSDPFVAPPPVNFVRGYLEGSRPNLAPTTSRAREFGRQLMQAGSLERIQGQMRGEEGRLAQALAPLGAFPGVGLTDPLEATTRLAGPAARVGAAQVRGAAGRVAEAATPVAQRLATEETGAIRITRKELEEGEGFLLSGTDNAGVKIQPLLARTRKAAEITRDEINTSRPLTQDVTPGTKPIRERPARAARREAVVQEQQVLPSTPAPVAPAAQAAPTPSAAAGPPPAAAQAIPPAALPGGGPPPPPGGTPPVAVGPLPAQAAAGVPPGGAPPPAPPAGAVPPVQPPSDWQSIVARLTSNIKAAKPARTETEALYSQERARRAAIFSQRRAAATTPEEVRRAQASLGGTLPRAQFVLPEGLSGEETQVLFDRIQAAGLRPFETASVDNALVRLLAADIPGRAELKLLERVFGSDLVKAILDKRSLGERALDEALDVMNVPRSLMSSADLSAPLRQGAVLGAGHPLIGGQAMGTMVKAMGREVWAQAADQAIKARPLFAVGQDAGLYLADLGGVAARITEREEAFMSRLIQRIPVLGTVTRASERAYVTFLNKLRSDVFDSVVNGWQRSGKVTTPEDLRKLARFVNWATGRGPVLGGDAAAVLNATFFAPRLITSRIMLPTTLITSTPLVRREAARSLAAFVAAGMAALGLAKLAGADVEDNPQSPDFGRIRMGPTRLDFWAGFQPIARYSAQIVTGRAKELPESGAQEHDINRMSRALRFVWSKMAPLPSFAVGLGVGKDIEGDPIRWTARAVGEKGLESVTPLFVQDLITAFQEEGIIGLAKAAPTGLGASVLTIQMDAMDKYWAAIEDQVPPELKPKWDKYFELETRDRQAYLRTLPRTDAGAIFRLVNKREALRIKMRRENPALDVLLVEQGYTPKTTEGRARLAELRGMPTSTAPAQLAPHPPRAPSGTLEGLRRQLQPAGAGAR